MQQNQKMLEHLAELNQELQYKRSVSSQLKKKPNAEKYTNLAQRQVHKIYWQYLGQSNTKVSETVSKEMRVIFATEVKNLNDIKRSNFKSVELNQKFATAKAVKDLTLKLRMPILVDRNQKLLRVELAQREQTLVKLETKANALIQKTSQGHQNFYQKWLSNHLKVKIAKTNIRIKDLKSFISSKSAFRKVYLSDEPPLSKLGWVKLFISYALILFWAVLILWPIAELIKATTNDQAISYLNVNSYSFGFESFSRLFSKTNYSKWLLNTIVIAVITSVLTVSVTLLMGFAFSRYRFRGKKISLLTVMILQMIPTLAALTVFYVLYTLLNQNLNISGQIVLVIIYVGGGVAGNTFIMKGYMDSISMEIDEAAKIDGLSQWRIFTRIITPLTRPMIALVALWSFIGPFGDFILPGLLLTNTNDFTLAQGLRVLITDQYQLDQAAFAAGSLIVAIPISLLFISLRKFLVGGITAGGVKG